jgi:tetratricopeptide (TPR) repeat protein
MNLAEALALRKTGRHMQARDALRELAEQNPRDAEVQYEAACVHDFLGQEREAAPYYVAALQGELPSGKRQGAYLGLGSTLRTIGRYQEASAVLHEGIEAFPEAGELKVFMAMVDYNLGHTKRAIEALLLLLAETSEDTGIRSYRQAIAFYSQDIERIATP